MSEHSDGDKVGELAIEGVDADLAKNAMDTLVAYRYINMHRRGAKYEFASYRDNPSKNQRCGIIVHKIGGKDFKDEDIVVEIELVIEDDGAITVYEVSNSDEDSHIPLTVSEVNSYLTQFLAAEVVKAENEDDGTDAKDVASITEETRGKSKKQI